MNIITLDDYYGNFATVSFSWSKEHDGDNTATVAYLNMISNDENSFAKIEITKWSDFYEIQTSIIPKRDCNTHHGLVTAKYDEYCNTERELCDWIRSLSYQYSMHFQK